MGERRRVPARRQRIDRLAPGRGGPTRDAVGGCAGIGQPIAAMPRRGRSGSRRGIVHRNLTQPLSRRIATP